MEERYFAGIDIGASNTKAVIINDNARLLGSSVEKTGIQYKSVADKCFKQALAEAGTKQEAIAGTVATGYGRKSTELGDWVRTEISCLSKGVYHYYPRSLCIVDIGGQDSKMIQLDSVGRIIDFQMNRKCAAGTGAFLEEIAGRLDLRPEELDVLARKSSERVELGSYCTVFTFTEILSHMQRGVSIEDLARGAMLSVVKRINEFGIRGSEVVLTGGVVEHNPLIAEMLQEEFQLKVLIPQRPQLMCAFGAALISREQSKK